MTRFHIGCSGFHYKHWRGSFYPDKLPQKKWFEYYCQHFDTLELNVTFYRFPQLTVLQKWYESSPANFMFSVKAPRVITHFKKFNGTERMLDVAFFSFHPIIVIVNKNWKILFVILTIPCQM